MKTVALLLLVALVVVASIHTLTSVNQDIGRHLALGKIIWETGTIPHVNLFSFTSPDFPFINHHWFAEVLLYLGDDLVGLKGLIIVKAVLIALAFGLALFASMRRDAVLATLIPGLFAVGILAERTDVRPEVLSFVFFGWFLFVLFGKREKLLWTLPLVQLFWVNTHIYFPIGPFVFLLFLVQEFFISGRNISRRWLYVGAAVFAVNFVNPFFWRGALYPLFVLHNYGYSIAENKSVFFLRDYGYPQFTSNALWAGIALIVLSIILNLRNFKYRFAGNFLAIATAAMALWMTRNFPLFGMSMIPAVAGNLYDLGIRDHGRKIFFAFSVVVAAIIYSVTTDQFSSRLPTLGRFGLDVPHGAQDAVDFVRSNGIKGPMFNNFDVGSFLIWKLPEEKVFIDGRPEAYPADFIRNTYIKMQEDSNVWRRESTRYGINFVFWDNNDMTPWSHTFIARMRKDPAWPLVYDDGRTLIFVRRGTIK